MQLVGGMSKANITLVFVTRPPTGVVLGITGGRSAEVLPFDQSMCSAYSFIVDPVEMRNRAQGVYGPCK